MNSFLLILNINNTQQSKLDKDIFNKVLLICIDITIYRSTDIILLTKLEIYI